MKLNPPEHICGQLRGRGASQRRQERREWIIACAQAGHHPKAVAAALQIDPSLTYGVMRQAPIQPVKAVRIAPAERRTRTVAVPTASQSMYGGYASVSMPRLPWDGEDRAVEARPETDPDRPAPRRKMRRISRPLTAYERVRKVIQEIAEQ